MRIFESASRGQTKVVEVQVMAAGALPCIRVIENGPRVVLGSGSFLALLQRGFSADPTAWAAGFGAWLERGLAGPGPAPWHLDPAIVAHLSEPGCTSVTLQVEAEDAALGLAAMRLWEALLADLAEADAPLGEVLDLLDVVWAALVAIPGPRGVVGPTHSRLVRDSEDMTTRLCERGVVITGVAEALVLAPDQHPEPPLLSSEDAVVALLAILDDLLVPQPDPRAPLREELHRARAELKSRDRDPRSVASLSGRQLIAAAFGRSPARPGDTT